MNVELVVALPAPKLLQKRLADGTYRQGDEGLEKRCSKCREYWPADNEFFYRGNPHLDGLNSCCRACYLENRYPDGRRKSKTTEGAKSMNVNTQPQAITSARDTADHQWMRSIEVALSNGEKPTYEALEQGVHALLIQTRALRSLVAEAEAAYSFIDDECTLVDIKGGMLNIRLQLDIDAFDREGAKGAIAAGIAALQAAKHEKEISAKKAEPANKPH